MRRRVRAATAWSCVIMTTVAPCARSGRPLSLTRKEFGILELLLAADSALVSAEEMLEHVWDANADPFSNIVSVTMARLRRKLGEPPLIETVVGKGYRV